MKLGMVENKVTGAALGASGGTIVANFVLWVLANYASADAAEAAPVIAFVNFVVASVGAFVAGYYTRHTQRGFEGEMAPSGDVDGPGHAM